MASFHNLHSNGASMKLRKVRVRQQQKKQQLEAKKQARLAQLLGKKK